jgi:hypothetical protein
VQELHLECEVYNSIKSAKVLWKALDRKYNAEDVGMKEFIIDKFLDFKMVNSRTAINQVQEF